MHDQLAPSKFVTEFFAGNLSIEGEQAQRFARNVRVLWYPGKVLTGVYLVAVIIQGAT